MRIRKKKNVDFIKNMKSNKIKEYNFINIKLQKVFL